MMLAEKRLVVSAEIRDTALSRNEALVSLWDEHGIAGDLRYKLVDILVKYGRDAALASTEAVIAAIKEVDGRYTPRSYYGKLH